MKIKGSDPRICMKDRIDIQISEQPLEQKDCFDFVSDDSVGGICVFVGTVRNHTKNNFLFHNNTDIKPGFRW